MSLRDVIHLDPETVVVCRARHEHRMGYRGYPQSDDPWKKGCISKAPLVGFLGEVAFSRWLFDVFGLDVQPDFEDRPYGDDGRDFVVGDLVVQAKTRRRDYGALLVRIDKPALVRPAAGGGVEIDPGFAAWGACVQLQAEPVWSAAGWAALVALVGWVTTDDLCRRGSVRPARARGQRHQNIEVRNADLRPIDDLLPVVEAAAFAAGLTPTRGVTR